MLTNIYAERKVKLLVELLHLLLGMFSIIHLSPRQLDFETTLVYSTYF